MSQENVESARRVEDAFNRRDVDAIVGEAVVDFEWFPAMPGTAPGSSFTGRSGIETYLGDLDATWEEYRSHPLEFRDLGDRVLMLGRLEGRGRGSGAWVDAPQGTVFDFRAGRLCCVRTHLDHAEALRSVGLEQ